MASGDVNTGGSTTTPNSPQVGKTTDLLLKGLRNTYKDGVGVYDKPLYTSPSAATQGAWGAGTENAYGLLGSGGFAPSQWSALGNFNSIGSDYRGLGDNNGLTDAQSSAMAGNAGLGAKYGGLGTAYDPNSAAYKTLRQGVVDDTLKNLGSQFTSSGRFGGGSYIDTASEGLGDALAGLDYNNMQNNINNQYRSLDAQRGIFGDQFGMGQQGVANQFGSLAGQQGTASALFDAGQQQIANKNSAVGSLGQIGASQDANSLASRMADYDLFTRQADAPWEALARSSSILSGTAGAAGSTTTNNIPWWSALLGTAATVGSFL